MKPGGPADRSAPLRRCRRSPQDLGYLDARAMRVPRRPSRCSLISKAKQRGASATADHLPTLRVANLCSSSLAQPSCQRQRERKTPEAGGRDRRFLPPPWVRRWGPIWCTDCGLAAREHSQITRSSSRKLGAGPLPHTAQTVRL